MPPRKLVLVVIDGLTAAAFERAAESPRTPALACLASHGDYRRAVSVFPSLTPVCVTSLATGAYPDVHRIPHLVWYDRDARRLIEYGSSFPAMVAAGTRRSIIDTIFNMNARHLGQSAVTIFEALEDAGLVTAAVNFTCYRGRNAHRTTLPGVSRVARGPRRFFFYSLFESDDTGAPLAVRRRAAGSIDDYATFVGRWLVTRDGFDFFVYYLCDYDYLSHALGPDGAEEGLVRVDRAVAALFDAAGGADAFLERYAVLLCSDHGQTAVREPVQLEHAFGDLRIRRRRGPAAADVVVAASNRAGMVYRLRGCKDDVRALAARLDGDPSVDVALFLEGGEAIARRDGEELRFAADGGEWRTSGDRSILSHPNALERVWHALNNPRAGELLVSAAEGYEFADLGGRHHAGGGSHGSLVAGDSEVPMLSVAAGPPPASIVGVAPAALAHFGVPLARAA